MAETETVYDPFLKKDVEISINLVNRLRGKYTVGPLMENGEPEFGWREFDVPPIQKEAADEIEKLRMERLENMRSTPPPLNFFSESVDAWGAAEWFNRLATAIRQQDAAVVAGDAMTMETCRNVAASSAMRLVRDYEQQVRAALQPAPQPVDDSECYYCGRQTSSLAGNPDQWPLLFCHEDQPGVVRWHHTGCVTDRLRMQPSSREAIAGLSDFQRKLDASVTAEQAAEYVRKERQRRIDDSKPYPAPKDGFINDYD